MRRLHQQQEMAEVEARGESTFIHRASNLPVVQSAMAKIGDVYENTKERNGLTRYTFPIAEQGMKLASMVAAPFVAPLHKPLSQVDKAAEGQLARLEEVYPVISKPTDELAGEVQQLYSATVQPAVDRAKQVKQYGEDTVTGVKERAATVYGATVTPALNTAAAARQYGVDTLASSRDKVVGTVSSVAGYGVEKSVGLVHSAASTAVGRTMVGVVNGALSTTERIVDYVMPSDGEAEPQDSGEDDPPRSVPLREIVDSVMEGEEDSDDDEFVVPREEEEGVQLPLSETGARVSRIGGKLRRRLMNRAVRNFNAMQLRSRAALDKLTAVVDLIDYAKKNIDSTKDAARSKVEDGANRMKEVWGSLLEEEAPGAQPATDADMSELTSDKRAVLLGRRFVTQLRRSLRATARAAESLPSPSTLTAPVSKAVSEALGFLDSSLYVFVNVEHVKDIPQASWQKMQEGLAFIRERLNEVAEYAAKKKEDAVQGAYELLGKGESEETPDGSGQRQDAEDDDDDEMEEEEDEEEEDDEDEEEEDEK